MLEVVRTWAHRGAARTQNEGAVGQESAPILAIPLGRAAGTMSGDHQRPRLRTRGDDQHRRQKTWHIQRNPSGLGSGTSFEGTSFHERRPRPARRRRVRCGSSRRRGQARQYRACQKSRPTARRARESAQVTYRSPFRRLPQPGLLCRRLCQPCLPLVARNRRRVQRHGDSRPRHRRSWLLLNLRRNQ
jgi:hypothetical protein